MSFEVQELTKADNQEAGVLEMKAAKDDPLLMNMKGTATDQDAIACLMHRRAPRFEIPGYFRAFKIVDTDTKKIVAWGGVTLPYTMTADQKAYLEREPLKAEGWNDEFLKIIPEQVGPWFESQGYDPSKHFHFKTTMVHPDYQRRGFGRWLTRTRNELADQANATIYVGAMPASVGMFQKEGFEIIDVKEFDASLNGGSGTIRMTCMKREPKGPKSQ